MKSLGSRRRAVTLIELMVVLAVLGLSYGIVGVAIRRGTRDNQAFADQRQLVARQIAHTRASAVLSGVAVQMTVHGPGGMRSATAFPDGRIVADSALSALIDLDALSGRSRHRRSNAADSR